MNGDKRREHILICSKKLFSERGYYDTQISHIVKEARIARGTIYQYFKNKDDLFITLLEDYYKLWEDESSINQDELDLKSIDSVDFLRFRIKKTLMTFANDHEYCNIILRIGLGLGGKLEPTINCFEKMMTRAISDDLEMGIRNNYIRKNIDTELMSNIIAGALLRTSYYYFVKKRKRYKESEIDRITEEFVSTFVSGIFT